MAQPTKPTSTEDLKERVDLLKDLSKVIDRYIAHTHTIERMYYLTQKKARLDKAYSNTLNEAIVKKAYEPEMKQFLKEVLS